MRYRMNLRIFEDGGNGTPAGQEGNAGNGNGGHGSAGATYSFEQAEEIANARAQRAEQAALRSYFQQQGMTQEEVTQALTQFKQQREAQKPNVSQIEKERDEARKELEAYKQKELLKESGVDTKYTDFVLFEVSKKVDDKTDFKTALKAFLKDNPQYAGGGYRVNVQPKSGAPSAGQTGTNTNDYVNAMIRKAARR
ncbi:MAG: hypothetical protein ACI4CZ_06165 [Hominisplanchenecus sp.]